MNCVVSVAGEAWREGSVKDADDARRLASPSQPLALESYRISLQPRDMADTEDHSLSAVCIQVNPALCTNDGEVGWLSLLTSALIRTQFSELFGYNLF